MYIPLVCSSGPGYFRSGLTGAETAGQPGILALHHGHLAVRTFDDWSRRNQNVPQWYINFLAIYANSIVIRLSLTAASPKRNHQL